MKKILKKSIIVMLITMLLFGTGSGIVNAVEGDEETPPIAYMVENNITFKDTIKRSIYDELILGNSKNETSFSLDRNNIKVENQQKVGSCWAFAFTSALETTIKNNKQYSPMHIEYKTGEMYNRQLGAGGNFLDAISYSVSGYGPVYEEDFPFESVYDEEKYSEENYYLADMNSVSLDGLKAEAIIKDATYFSPIYKKYAEDGTITYTDADTSSFSLSSYNTYTDKEVSAIRDMIKSHIKQYGGVIAAFYSDFGITAEEEIISAHGYFNTETNAFYCNGKGMFGAPTINHAVTIIGWDDNYSKENFTEGIQPKNDGAYIVLNSYGTDFGDNGYFYVSYDDMCVEQQVLGISQVEEIDYNSKNVEYKYQYDELGANYALAFSTDFTGLRLRDTLYGANVYTKQDTNHIESLTEIGIFMLNAQGIEVYVNPENDNIDNCTLVASYTGENALEVGYHTLKLPSPIDLTGDKFVIKVKFINAEGASVPVECNYKNSGYTKEIDENFITRYENATSKAGESYFSLDDKQWNDLYGYKGSSTITFKDSNICIKAFTVQGDEKVAVTGVSLDNKKLTIQAGEKKNLVATVKPSKAFNKNVTWTSSDESVVTVSETGIITAVAKGTATITVKTEDGEYTATCTITVNEKTNYKDDIYKDDDSSKKDKNDSDGKGSKEDKSSSEDKGSKKDSGTQKNTENKAGNDSNKVSEDSKSVNKSESSNSSKKSGTNNNKSTESSSDKSMSNKIFPQAGSKFLGIVVVGIVVVLINRYRKYKKYNVK